MCLQLGFKWIQQWNHEDKGRRALIWLIWLIHVLAILQGDAVQCIFLAPLSFLGLHWKASGDALCGGFTRSQRHQCTWATPAHLEVRNINMEAIHLWSFMIIYGHLCGIYVAFMWHLCGIGIMNFIMGSKNPRNRGASRHPGILSKVHGVQVLKTVTWRVSQALNQWFRSPFPAKKDIVLEYLSTYIYIYNIYIYTHYIYIYILCVHTTIYSILIQIKKTSLFDILFDGSIVAYLLKQSVFFLGNWRNPGTLWFVFQPGRHISEGISHWTVPAHDVCSRATWLREIRATLWDEGWERWWVYVHGILIYLIYVGAQDIYIYKDI